MTSSKLSISKVTANTPDEIEIIQEFAPVSFNELLDTSFEKLVSLSFNPVSNVSECSQHEESEKATETKDDEKLSCSNSKPREFYILRHRITAIGIVVAYDGGYIIFRSNDTISIENEMFDEEKIFSLIYTVKKIG